MRVLIALSGTDFSLQGGPAAAGARAVSIGRATRAVARVAEDHEVVVAYPNGLRVDLELALRNALPERDVVTIPIDVVVSAGDQGGRNGTRPLPPQAIIELRSLRTLIDSGVLVGCEVGGGGSIALDGEGTMLAVDAAVDANLTVSLLARRLDVDMLLILTDATEAVPADCGEGVPTIVRPAEFRERGLASFSNDPMVEAACSFVETTGRRVAIGQITQAAELVRGASGIQVS